MLSSSSKLNELNSVQSSLQQHPVKLNEFYFRWWLLYHHLCRLLWTAFQAGSKSAAPGARGPGPHSALPRASCVTLTKWATCVFCKVGIISVLPHREAVRSKRVRNPRWHTGPCNYSLRLSLSPDHGMGNWSSKYVSAVPGHMRVHALRSGFYIEQFEYAILCDIFSWEAQWFLPLNTFPTSHHSQLTLLKAAGVSCGSESGVSLNSSHLSLYCPLVTIDTGMCSGRTAGNLQSTHPLDHLASHLSANCNLQIDPSLPTENITSTEPLRELSEFHDFYCAWEQNFTHHEAIT